MSDQCNDDVTSNSGDLSGGKKKSGKESQLFRECPTGGRGDGGALSDAVTGQCFPPAYKCQNCEHKLFNILKDKNVKLNLKLKKVNETDYKGESIDCKAKNKQKNGNMDKEKVKSKDCKPNIEKKYYKENSEKDCKKKMKDDDKLKTKDNQVYKRCTGCWLMTYCDINCQKEHWERVHKYHCQYLSGKKQVQVHTEDSCKMCIKHKKSDNNSPKIRCTIEAENKRMSKELGAVFGYHGVGKVCNCSLEYSFKHPFPMGEIPGKQVCMGLDEIIVHTERVVTAMINKAMNGKQMAKQDIDKLFVMLKGTRNFRVNLWVEILVHGTYTCSAGLSDIITEDIMGLLDELQVNLGDDVWWKILKFSTKLINSVTLAQFSAFIDSNSLDDPKFANFKSLNSERADQFRNIVFVSENNLWSRFKLWPTLVDQSLVIFLPKGVHCLMCREDLAGQDFNMPFPTIAQNENWPILIPEVAERGEFSVFCSYTRNPRCIMVWYELQKGTLGQTPNDAYLEGPKEQELFLNDAKHCTLCLKMSLSSHRCSECLAVQYCSSDCQMKDLQLHLTVCSTWAKDPNKKLASSKNQKKLLKMKRADVS